MKFLSLFLSLNLVLSYADWGHPEQNDSIVATPENLEALLNQYEETFVYFHLPECKHCVAIE